MNQIKTIELLRSKYNSLVISKSQTAEELRVSQATIDRMRKIGDIESVKVGGSVMFKIDEIARFLSEA